MASETTEKVIEYEKLSTIKLKSGFLIKSARDPSDDMEAEVRAFMQQRRPEFNRVVSSTFELPDSGFTKFEFYWMPQRAQKITNASDRINGQQVEFKSLCDVTILYLKDRSLILFSTEYRFAITAAGCGGKSTIWRTGGRNFTLEEIYFNKITTVGALHEEEIYNIIRPGCSGGSIGKYTISRDGFIIRAGESFRVLASERYANELRDARAMINQKISSTN